MRYFPMAICGRRAERFERLPLESWSTKGDLTYPELIRYTQAAKVDQRFCHDHIHDQVHVIHYLEPVRLNIAYSNYLRVEYRSKCDDNNVQLASLNKDVGGKYDYGVDQADATTDSTKDGYE
jgi:hypothetical protein